MRMYFVFPVELSYFHGNHSCSYVPVLNSGISIWWLIDGLLFTKYWVWCSLLSLSWPWWYHQFTKLILTECQWWKQCVTPDWTIVYVPIEFAKCLHLFTHSLILSVLQQWMGFIEWMMQIVIRWHAFNLYDVILCSIILWFNTCHIFFVSIFIVTLNTMKSTVYERSHYLPNGNTCLFRLLPIDLLF